jgi:uncharacterized SAM-binding protein YcdF (DUF218 family)
LLVVLAFTLGVTVLMAGTAFRIWQVGQQDGRRLDQSIALYKEGYATYLITTGGNLPGDWTTEAEVGRRYAVKMGVPDSAILMENTGHSTLDSIQHVRAIFLARGLRTALFVSDRSHMLRVLRLAQDEGIEAWASPTSTSPDDIDSDLIYTSMIHEVGAMGYYMLVAEDPDRSTAAPGTSDQSAPPTLSPAP